MKHLIIILMILHSTFVKAQRDSIKVSFSEEKVESFEKTTLIDEYEKAFGNKRLVKSALRISFNGSTSIGLGQEAIYTRFGAFMAGLNPSIQFEEKIDLDKSIIASLTEKKEIIDLAWNTGISLEGRWYYRMKERVKTGKQLPNITGKYLSVKFERNIYKLNEIYLTDYKARIYGMFRPVSTYGVNWGQQLGNNVNYGLSIGIKHGKTASLDAENKLLNINQSSQTSTTWFISSNTQGGMGLFFPSRKKLPPNFCDFLQCNYEVKELLKINLNNVLYLDRYNQNLKLDIAYEIKLGESPLSINSNVILNYMGFYSFRGVGQKRDTIFNESGQIKKIEYNSIYSSKMGNAWAGSFQLIEQFRHYIGMGDRVANGKSANNLNGFYMGITGAYTVSGIEMSNNFSIKYLGAGLSLGYQIQTNRKSFIDLSSSIIRQSAFIRKKLTEAFTLIELSLKLGIAK